MPSQTVNKKTFQISSKFFPPQYDDNRHLLRQRIVSRLTSNLTDKGKSIVIEGQAGQGKSLLAVQFLNCNYKPFVWFQLGGEESDPVLFLKELLGALRTKLPEFNSTDLNNWLLQGDTFPLDCSRLATILTKDLENHLNEDFYVVFDDIHLLDGYDHSLAFLAALLKANRCRLHFILISRQSIFEKISIEKEKSGVQLVQNHDLALNRQEIAELFNVYFQIPVGTKFINEIFQRNEGWIMGLILAAHDGDIVTTSTRAVNSIDKYSQKNFLQYFSHEVLQKIPEEFQENILKLSLLDEVPIELGVHICKNEDILNFLENLENRNFFVRSLNEEKTLFSFHHLFQESLRKIAEERKGRKWIDAIFIQAGDWYCDSVPEKALSYFLRAQQFKKSQHVLIKTGMQLLANNRLVSLQQYLSLIPHEVFQIYPWLSYFNGVVHLGVEPQKAISYLESARIGFIQEQDEVGELSALIQIIFYHTAIDCHFKRGQTMLERAINLYEKHTHKMEIGQQAHAANILVVGLTFFVAEMERTKKYSGFGLETAIKLQYKNLEAEARLARSYRDLFAGNLLACRHETDRSLSLLKDPQVSLISKATLQLAQLNLLVNEGDFLGYKHHLNLYRKAYGDGLVEQSSFAALMRHWEIDLALARGDWGAAEKILKIALDHNPGGVLPHIQSLYLQQKAYLMACQNKADESITALRDSQRLRRQVGGTEFVIINCALLGATYGRLGQFIEAMETFDHGLKASETSGELFVRPAIYAHRAFLYLKQGQLNLAAKDIHNMLHCMLGTGFRSFYGWDPEIVAALLSEAVRQKIYAEFSKELAITRLGLFVADDGTVYPLLHVSIVGGINISRENNSLSYADLTRSMRNLLTILIAAPKHQLDQEFIQNELWPDEPANRGRSRLDTLILRIRKLINQKFPQVDAKLILTLQNGILSLQNCTVDIDNFRQHIKSGLNHARRQEDWQAMESLRQGLSLCNKESDGNLFAQLDQSDLAQELLVLYLKGSCEYSRLLAENEMVTEAIATLRKAIRHEPTHEPLVRLLYDLIIRQGHSHLAHRIVQDYRAALEKEDYPVDDVERILESFWN